MWRTTFIGSDGPVEWATWAVRPPFSIHSERTSRLPASTFRWVFLGFGPPKGTRAVNFSFLDSAKGWPAGSPLYNENRATTDARGAGSARLRRRRRRRTSPERYHDGWRPGLLLKNAQVLYRVGHIYSLLWLHDCVPFNTFTIDILYMKDKFGHIFENLIRRLRDEKGP